MENIKLCPYCNSEINVEAIRCKHCKEWLCEPAKKSRKFLETMLLSMFLGIQGIHRFYTGYYVIGTIQLLTFGGFGLWSMVDFISICIGRFKDSAGLPLEDYSRKLGVIALILSILSFLFVLFLIFALVFVAVLDAMCSKGI